MTDVSSLLLGWLGIASMLMAFGAYMVSRRQRALGEQWGTSLSLQLSTALYIHGISAIPMFVATLVAVSRPIGDPSIYLMWTTWAGWLIAKTIVVRVTGHFKPAMALYAAWLIVWVLWRNIL